MFKTKIDNAIQRLVANPLPVIGVWIVLALLLLPGAMRLQINTDYTENFAQDHPHRIALDKINQDFPLHENIVIALDASEDDLFNQRHLSLVQEITDGLQQFNHVVAVQSLTNHHWFETDQASIAITQPLRNPQAHSAEQWQTLKNEALNDPMLMGKLLSPDARSTLIAATFSLPEPTSIPMQTIYEQASQLVNHLETNYPDVRFYLTGTITGNEAFKNATQQDLLTLIPVSYLLMIALIIGFFSGWLGLLILLSTITLTNLLTLSIKGWLDPMITANDAFAPTLLMTVAVANGIHLLTHFCKRQPSSSNIAIIQMLQANRSPIIITNMTTTIGMLCLNFTDTPTLASFGNLVAIGVIIAMLLSLTWVPALLACATQTRLANQPRQTVLFQMLIKSNRAIAHSTQRTRATPLFVSLLMMILLIGGITQVSWTDTVTQAFRIDHPFRQANDFINQSISGLFRLEFAIELTDKNTDDKNANDENKQNSNAATATLLADEHILLIEQFEQWLLMQPEITHVDSIIDALYQLDQLIRPEDNTPDQTDIAPRPLPNTPHALSHYLLVYELASPAGSDLRHLITDDRQALRLTAKINEIDAQQLIALERRAKQWFDAQAPASLNLTIASTDLALAHVVHSNIHGFVISTMTALLLIAVLLALLFKSVILGVVATLTNLLPLAITFGLWGHWQGNIGLSAAAVGAISLGLVVDDTVHLLFRTRQHLLSSKGADALTLSQALLKAVEEVGPALLITTLIFTVGFSVLIASHYLPTQMFGQLLCCIMIVALTLDLWLLPSALFFFDRIRQTLKSSFTLGATNNEKKIATR